MLLRLTSALSLCLTAAPAMACSVAPGYRVPTTLELVDRADAIVLARVEDGPAAREGADDSPINVVPILLLKGHILPGPLAMPGWVETGDVRATRSDPDELAAPNPDALTGGCNRYIFARGMTLLLFLSDRNGAWQPISYPFARTAEDVPGFDARWVRAVREYIAIAALPRETRSARLAARRDALRAAPDADARAIAENMDRELRAPRKPLREPLSNAPRD